MNSDLHAESERLAASWEQHDAAMLRDYLVQDVEDPRLNAQSILSRHYLIFAATGGQFRELADEELAFAAVANWALHGLKRQVAGEDFTALRLALERAMDNAEGIELPPFVRRTFARLPRTFDGLLVPNYVETLFRELAETPPHSPPRLPAEFLDLFMRLWNQALAPIPACGIRVVEPACGSANDFRFWVRCGLARLIDYCGFDLSPKNVANALSLFPEARFHVGNILCVGAPDLAYDLAVVHDLFEHLSLRALPTAIGELCRVVERGLCLHFFNMDEIDEHVVRPVEDYHWNTLSLDRIRETLASHGFTGQAFHIGTYLRWRAGSDPVHNPAAYTLLLGRTTPKEPTTAMKPAINNNTVDPASGIPIPSNTA